MRDVADRHGFEPSLADLARDDECLLLDHERLVRLPEADFRGADLRGADLWGANLREAMLTGVDFRVDGGITAAYVTPE